MSHISMQVRDHLLLQHAADGLSDYAVGAMPQSWAALPAGFPRDVLMS